MARKTNKTDHVLGLLAGKSEDTGAVENKEKAAANEDMSGTVAGSNVQVVAKQDEDEVIADTVKHLLEEELEAEEISIPEAGMIFDDAEEEEALKAAEEEALKIIEEEERMAAEEEARKAEEARLAAEEEALKAEEEKEAAEEERRAAEAKKAAEEEELKRAEEEALKAAEEEALKAAGEGAQKTQAEKEYVFLNVMETLVRERIDMYMKQFATCTCSRCKADITALALTSLPAKYVVVSKNAATPLMNFYSQRYSGAITVEITKACTKVKEHPHHGRD